MKEVIVSASKEYKVIIDKDILNDSGKYIKEIVGGRIAAIITDDIVDSLYSKTVVESLTEQGYIVQKYVFENGEKSKNVSTYISIVNFLAEHKLSRTDVVVALGGGVVGDMAGFAAATYLRGIKFVQIPTTLLAAVDSSVGGKTAIDLEVGKNLVGAFYQPSLVICDYLTLDTLKPETFSDGCAEVIKYGIIASKELFDKCMEGIRKNIEEIIYECVKIKRDIVAQDEFDTGLRQLLNYGHTIGHGVEACSGYNITHGKGVSIGMVAITKAAVELGMCSEDVLAKLKECLALCNLPLETNFSANELYEVMLSDKKINGTSINLVIPIEIGKAVLHKVKTTDLKKYLYKGGL